MSAELIEKIHHTVRTFVNKTKKKSIVKDLSKEKSNADVLSNLGFGSTENVKSYRTARNKQEKRLTDTSNYNLSLEKARYYHEKYGVPCISIDVIKEVCDKYKLAFISASSYTGKVPQKNIDELSAWNHEKLDECDYAYTDSTWRDSTEKERDFIYKTPTYMRDKMRSVIGMTEDMRNIQEEVFCDKPEYPSTVSRSLRIVCPLHECEARSYYHYVPYELLRKNQDLICDPIVLLPVNGADRIGDNYKTPMFLVLTMWGLESFDSKLNPNGIDKQLNLN